MAGTAPDYLDVDRHRDWAGRTYERWLPNTLFALLCLLPLLALLNVFGQTPDTVRAANPNGAATLELQAPTAVRSGLLWQARFDIHANREIKDAVLVLETGWLEQMSVNTIEPSPANESSKDGALALDLGDIPAGKTWRQYLQFQANPVNAGTQGQSVTLYDGNVPLLHIHRDLMVWP